MFTDITERKRTEERLSRSRAMLAAAERIGNVGGWELEVASGRLTWSEEVYRILGLAPSEFAPTYEAFLDLVHSEDRAAVDAAYSKSIRNGADGYEIEHRIIRKGTGQTRTVREKCEHGRDSSGRTVRSIGMIQDVTDRKLLEAQFVQAQKMESIGRLAGGVAHDFDNMLGVTLGHAEPALERAAGREEIAAERSADLTRRLPAFARKQTISPRVLDLNDVIGAAPKMLRRLIGDGIALEWRPGNDVWPVIIDPSQIDQILANLCINSRDAIAGTGTVRIETANLSAGGANSAVPPGATPGECVVLSVSDDGCGMDKAVMSRLFEPFFTTKELGKGTGLGLATIYGVVKQNEGFIDVRSEPGRGTTFSVHLPRYAEEPAPARRGASEDAVIRGSETVLVVEDEPANLRLIEAMLRRHGYTVLAAKLREALDGR